MAVEVGVSMTRKVLGTGGQTASLHRVDHRRAARRDDARLGPERSRADDGVGRIAVDVHHRREIKVDSDRKQIHGESSPDLHGGVDARGTDLAHRGRRREVLGEPDGVSALLIDADHDRVTRRIRREPLDRGDGPGDL